MDKEQDERRHKTFSEIKSPSTTDMTNSQNKLALSQCPVYVNSPSAARSEKNVEYKMDDVYHTVNPTYETVNPT